MSKKFRRITSVPIGISTALMTGIGWTQGVPNACQISIGYGPVLDAAISPVPGIGLAGLSLLGAAVATAAWRSTRIDKTGRHLSIIVAAGAAALSFGSGGAFIRSVQAAAPYEFNNPVGGILTDTEIAFASPSPLLTVTNTSGKRIKITTNGNTTDTGSCVVGLELANGDTCTTQAVCPQVTMTEVVVDPTFTCDFANPIDTFAWAIGPISITNYAPMLENPPTFDPPISGYTTSFSYTRSATVPVYGPGGEITNAAELGSGLVTYTITSPNGHAFGASMDASRTWTSPFSCQTRTGGGGGNN